MKEKILDLKSQGKTFRQIRDEVGCSLSTISYHLSESQKEKTKARLKRSRASKCSCGNNKNKEAASCRGCYNKNRSIQVRDKPIKYFFDQNRSNHRFVKIRKYARQALVNSGVEKKCALCEFSEYVETCHKKPISSFSAETPLRIVNAVDNLIFLCPNHHILLDKGLISL